MGRHFLFAWVAAASTVSVAQETQGYICVADKASGFKFNKEAKEWEHARFNVKDNKYILTKKGAQWEWKALGSRFPTPCGDDFNAHGFLSCSSVEEITFNRNSLRFQSVYPIGYVHNGQVKNEGGDTPSIEIGRCTVM